MSFPVFYLTKLMKRLSLNLEGERGFLRFLGRGWQPKLPSQGKYGKKSSSFYIKALFNIS
jgi:hypothetical protein